MGFRFHSVADYAAAYREGRATPSQVAERALAAAAELDRREPPLRAFIALSADDVRAQAEAATARHRAGRPLGPLDGVLVAVKDEYDVAGYARTCGTSFLGGRTATADALVVARLREAGAVIFGKANMHEFGMQPSGLNLHHGTARNPYDPARDTGGSSSGSAAAVASGLVPIALGADGGGSLRVPGALCGVPSIKGTFERVPTEGLSILCWSLEHAGPLGATVADVALAFATITAEEPAPTPRGLPPGRPPDGGPLRVGVAEAWWRHAGDEVAHVARAAVDRLVAAGAVEVRVELPHIDLALPVGAATFTVEGAVSVEPHLVANRPMGPAVRLAFDMARGVPATTFVKAQRARALIARDFEAALAAADVLVTPTTAATAPRYREDALRSGELDEAAINRMVVFTFPLNLTGLPAAQVPCGYDAEGLPVGLQVIAPHGEDLLALAVAAEVERAVERRRPAVWVDLLA
jgi:Asp-tRNA(Asn)/Glu-tRNA(Gln) amidotransferase A subunit family amidase